MTLGSGPCKDVEFETTSAAGPSLTSLGAVRGPSRPYGKSAPLTSNEEDVEEPGRRRVTVTGAESVVPHRRDWGPVFTDLCRVDPFRPVGSGDKSRATQGMSGYTVLGVGRQPQLPVPPCVVVPDPRVQHRVNVHGQVLPVTVYQTGEAPER